MNEQEDLVFISYAREDRTWAERLYMDLRKHEINAWLDVKCLRAGAKWKHEISKAIRRARYFLLLISKHSVNKRGYVQKEIKQGLDVLEEFPTGSIFMIPVRLDDTVPVDEELHELNWVDLMPAYHDGLARITSVLAELKKSPLKYADGGMPTVTATVIDKGQEITTELPLILGDRAAVSYAPFRSAREFLQQFFDRLPTHSMFASTALSYYVTLSTQHPAVRLGEDLLEKYPSHITLVLQNAFRELKIWNEGVSAALSFGGKYRTVAIPFDAILEIHVPEIGVRVTLEQPSRP